eukprot:1970414-Pyramimonas_sp.AAC.1
MPEGTEAEAMLSRRAATELAAHASQRWRERIRRRGRHRIPARRHPEGRVFGLRLTDPYPTGMAWAPLADLLFWMGV